MNYITQTKKTLSKTVKFIFPIAFSVACTATHAYPTTFSESAQNFRFEQYDNGSTVLWAMPTPGSSVHPGSGCKSITISASNNFSSRFVALYLFANARAKRLHITYDVYSCEISSYAMDN